VLRLWVDPDVGDDPDDTIALLSRASGKRPHITDTTADESRWDAFWA
jgi:hypothetical protein